MKTYLESKGCDVVLTREPGGTYISEKIRDIILDKGNFGMEPMAEALLYAASRAQHVAEKIRPALLEGKIVICDKFTNSSIASWYSQPFSNYLLKHNGHHQDNPNNDVPEPQSYTESQSECFHLPKASLQSLSLPHTF